MKNGAGIDAGGPSSAVFDELSDCLPPGRILRDPDVVAGLSRDQAPWATAGRPLAVVRAQTTAEVAHVVRVCHRHGVPLVARGAGSGLSGGANAIEGGIVLSLERMTEVLEIDPLERLAVVQPGVVNDDLRAAAAEQGLWYPPDPGSSSWSTIGGNVATNAGGMCCVKYGVTRDYVLGLEVVTGTGETVRLGRRTAKGVAGYDLVGLLVGSEGTLGVVTEVTVRLRPLPQPSCTVAGYFASLTDAGTAVQEAARTGLTPSVFELVDRTCLRAVDAWKNMGVAQEAEVLLLAQFDDPGAAGEALADAMVACFDRAGAGWAERSTDAAESRALLEARRVAFPAVERMGTVLTEDVCVPKANLVEMLRRIESAAARHEITIANLAHAGDGNLHPLLVVPPGDDAAAARARRAFDEIVDDALALGGTVTGEHGVGLLKRDGLASELSSAVLGMHRDIKAALDPGGILNPGKVFAGLDAWPPTGGEGRRTCG